MKLYVKKASLDIENYSFTNLFKNKNRYGLNKSILQVINIYIVSIK